MLIEYRTSLNGISPGKLTGFFVGWPNPPSPEMHMNILKGSSHCILAIDEGSKRVIGFINAISDGVLSAYIPLLEVLREYQGQGIGTELVQRMLEMLKNFYMIDLTCDADMQPFYEKLAMHKSTGMLMRNYKLIK